eukprot:s2917_g5.t1
MGSEVGLVDAGLHVSKTDGNNQAIYRFPMIFLPLTRQVKETRSASEAEPDSFVLLSEQKKECDPVEGISMVPWDSLDAINNSHLGLVGIP